MNLFQIPKNLPEQELTEILLDGSTRIERIVSSGQTSDWYDQTEDEWVCVLSGTGGTGICRRHEAAAVRR